MSWHLEKGPQHGEKLPSVCSGMHTYDFEILCVMTKFWGGVLLLFFFSLEVNQTMGQRNMKTGT